MGDAGGGDLVERRVEAALDVLRDGGASEQEGVDPARELVAQVLGAARQDGEARLEGGRSPEGANKRPDRLSGTGSGRREGR